MLISVVVVSGIRSMIRSTRRCSRRYHAVTSWCRSACLLEVNVWYDRCYGGRRASDWALGTCCGTRGSLGTRGTSCRHARPPPTTGSCLTSIWTTTASRSASSDTTAAHRPVLASVITSSIDAPAALLPIITDSAPQWTPNVFSKTIYEFII